MYFHWLLKIRNWKQQFVYFQFLSQIEFWEQFLFFVHFGLWNKFFSFKNRKLFLKTENKGKKQLPNISLYFVILFPAIPNGLEMERELLVICVWNFMQTLRIGAEPHLSLGGGGAGGFLMYIYFTNFYKIKP